MSGKPEYVTRLEAVYGAPSQAGFGSAVFCAEVMGGNSLEEAALDSYRTFLGPLWERFGEDAWMGPWQMVYSRPPHSKQQIVGELKNITEQNARMSIDMVLNGVADGEAARAALSAAYDDAAVDECAVYAIGDGAAMSGIILAGRRKKAGEALFLVFLMD